MNKKSRRSASFSGCGFGDAFFPFPSIHFNWRRKRRRIWCCIKNYYPESKAEWLGSNEWISFFIPPSVFSSAVRLQSVSFANRSYDRMTSMIWHKKGRKECVEEREEEREEEEEAWSTAWQNSFLSSIAPLVSFHDRFLCFWYILHVFWRQSIDLRTWLFYL